MSEPFPFQSAAPAEQRQQVEAAIGVALNEAFDRNQPFVVSNAAGVDRLTLYIPRERALYIAETSLAVDVDGDRTAHMLYGYELDGDMEWDNVWEFTDGPGKSPRIEPRRIVAETGQFTPIPSPTSRQD